MKQNKVKKLALQTEGTPETSTLETSPTKKTKKTATKKAEVKKLNTDKVGKETAAKTADREVKYLYPADCNTASKKKMFRRNSRAAAAKFEKTIAALQADTSPKAKSELKAVLAKRADFRKVTYTGKS